MKIGIMQPYFLPYLGYISLIKHTDRFILLDDVQFIRHGWIERNRILKPNSGWQYIRVPICKHSRNTLIKDILINNEIDWKCKMINQLQYYKKKAPYFYIVIDILKDVFSKDFNDIVSLNLFALKEINAYLGIEKSIEVFSRMNIKIGQVNAPDEWALNICQSIGDIHEYWNPPGGKSFFNPSKYDQNNIKLKFHSIQLSEYNQKQIVFEPGLSIIDVMMFNNVDEINEMLDGYTFV